MSSSPPLLPGGGRSSSIFLPPMILDPGGISFPSRSNTFADVVFLIPVFCISLTRAFSICCNIIFNSSSLLIILGSMLLRINRSAMIFSASVTFCGSFSVIMMPSSERPAICLAIKFLINLFIINNNSF